jgi:hypothetical protein
MSCLKLHWPLFLSLYPPSVAAGQPHADDDDGPVILKFPNRTDAVAGRIGPSSQSDLLERARILHENRCCPDCGRAAVVPVDAEPAVAFRDSLSIPGTGRLIGFQCDCCGYQWEA